MTLFRLLFCCCCISTYCHAQDSDSLEKMVMLPPAQHVPISGTYKTTRIIQAHSTELLKKHELDFRVTHRFGDAGGEFGGIKTFYGTDNSSDIRIAFEYGIADNLMVGVSRSKGSGDLQQLYEGLVKYRLLQQTTDNYIPVSLAFFGNMVISGMPASDIPSAVSHFDNFQERITYVSQAIVSRRIGALVSVTLLPTYVHRNRVAYMDENNLFALGVAGRLKLSRRVGVLAEYFYPFRSAASKEYFKTVGTTFYNPLGVGIEIETGGHVFQITFTNSTAILENQFIPETTTSWLQGQFRWGFNISRRFSIFGKKDWKK
jgi:hypothetical protein